MCATRSSTQTRGKTTGKAWRRPDYKKNDFGYTFGGPVFIPNHYNSDKKKTFFFWSQEWRREIVPGSTISQNVPSDAERGGNFNDVCPAYTGAAFDPTAFPDCPYQSGNPGTPFVNNTLPGTNSTTVPALLSMIPKANNTLGTYATGQAAGSPLPAYVANPSYPTNWREELIRVDQNFSENERLTVRYIHDSWSTINQGPLWGVYNNSFDNTNTNFVGPTTSFVVRLTSTIKPNLLNEFVASYTADHIILSNITNVALPSGGIDLLPLFPAQFTQANKIPAISVGNTNGNGIRHWGIFGGYRVLSVEERQPHLHLPRHHDVHPRQPYDVLRGLRGRSHRRTSSPHPIFKGSCLLRQITRIRQGIRLRICSWVKWPAMRKPARSLIFTTATRSSSRFSRMTGGPPRN